MSLSIALDLGTSKIKAATLSHDGSLQNLQEVDSPPPYINGLICEYDPKEYLRLSTELLKEIIKDNPGKKNLGISSQRSSFLLWNRKSGEPITPLISWQDRRAKDWCERHASLNEAIYKRTGLPLSPHYAGPKLASMTEKDANLRNYIDSGLCLFGNLETYLIWNWSKKQCHHTDISMAARTLLADPEKSEWDSEVLLTSGIPKSIFPSINSSSGHDIPLINNIFLKATVSDQASGTLATLGEQGEGTLINIGTGAFVLKPTGKEFRKVPGYLSGPLYENKEKQRFYSIEGTVNGGGAVADRFGSISALIPSSDPTPKSFCIPDLMGLGSPHWKPEITLIFSEDAKKLPPEQKRRIILEGIIFRIREILEGMEKECPSGPIYLSGGLSKEIFVSKGLASCLQKEIKLLSNTESSLMGAARLAAGLKPFAVQKKKILLPDESCKYLHGKYEQWKEWMDTALLRNSSPRSH
ncbi:MAG: glycerol kinase [Chlamydiales bacterium]|jgi:glycerol kinase